MSATWAMGRALSELMQRHAVTLPSPTAVPLSPPTEGPMLLSGLASTSDIDIERVQFAPRAFGDVPLQNVPLHFDHQGIVAGRIEALGYNAYGELTIAAFVEHPMARRCNAFSVSGDVESYTMHEAGSQNFFARVEKIRLREISLVPAPVNIKARVLQRELPSAASRFVAGTMKQFDLLIAGVKLLQKEVQLLQKINDSEERAQ